MSTCFDLVPYYYGTSEELKNKIRDKAKPVVRFWRLSSCLFSTTLWAPLHMLALFDEVLESSSLNVMASLSFITGVDGSC